MITHAVFFWLNNPDSTEDRDTLIEGVRGLSAIEQVRSLVVGTPAATEPRGPVDNTFAVSEIITFDNEADEHTYQVHPLHQKFIAEHEHLWSRVTVYDVTHL